MCTKSITHITGIRSHETTIPTVLGMFSNRILTLLTFYIFFQGEAVVELCESHFQCSVCNELLVKATGLQCGHTFCLDCVEKWRRKSETSLDPMLRGRKATCPICRSEILTQAPLKTVDSFLEKAVEIFFNDEAKKSRKELLSSTVAPTVAPIPTSTSASSQFLQMLYSIQGRGLSGQLGSRTQPRRGTRDPLVVDLGDD